MTNGLLSVRQRAVKTEEMAVLAKKREELKEGTYKYYMQGKDTSIDTVIKIFYHVHYMRINF